jgi:hypothetical protein
MARPTRFTVLAAASLVVPVDYLSDNLSISIVPVGGSTTTVTGTLDDPNDSTYTAIYFAMPTPFNAGIAANTLGFLSNQQVRALKFTVAGGTSAIITLIQTSGSGGDA